MPLTRVTEMLPASATRPDAVTMALLDATWPLLMPIETVAPLGQAVLVEAICTFHSPSKVAAAAGVAMDVAISSRKRAAITGLRKCSMASPFGWTPTRSHGASPVDVMGVTPAARIPILG